MRIHTTHTRDAALRQLSHLNRWLVAGSVLLTGALTEAAAHAFPGRTIKRSATAATKAARKAHEDGTGHAGGGTTTSGSSTAPLQPPAQAPQGAGESTQAQEPAPEQESQATHETTPEPAPESEAAPAQEAPPAETTHESAPAPAPAPEPEPEPVVSGGS
jgi:outer membrane biosynthesis protein TonB